MASVSLVCGRVWASLSLLSLFSLLLLSTGVSAWGNVGHQSTAAIASKLLTTSAASRLQTLLGASLESVATWADEVKKEKTWAWSAPLHYIDTKDYACDYEYSRDCVDSATGEKGACVAGAIANYSRRAVATPTQEWRRFAALANVSIPPTESGQNLTKDTAQAIAVKFLVHFVGDIHQPLHVGFTSDRGGNEIFVDYFGTHIDLHSIWDENIIATILQRNFSNSQEKWVAELARRVSSGGEWYTQAQTWGRCASGELDCTSTMASEGVTYACANAYRCVRKGSEPCASMDVKQGSSLAEAYYAQAAPIVNLRIAQGGVRLAALLNDLFG